MGNCRMSLSKGKAILQSMLTIWTGNEGIIGLVPRNFRRHRAAPLSLAYLTLYGRGWPS